MLHNVISLTWKTHCVVQQRQRVLHALHFYAGELRFHHHLRQWVQGFRELGPLYKIPMPKIINAIEN